MSEVRRKFIRKLEVRGLAKSTIRLYLDAVTRLSRFYSQTPIGLTRKRIENFIRHERKIIGLEPSSINVHINAFKTFYRLMEPDRNVMKGFMRIRQYGFLSNRVRSIKLKLCMELLGKQYEKPMDKPRKWHEIILELKGVDLTIYPVCKKGRLRFKEKLLKSAYSSAA